MNVHAYKPVRMNLKSQGKDQLTPAAIKYILGFLQMFYSTTFTNLSGFGFERNVINQLYSDVRSRDLLCFIRLNIFEVIRGLR